MASKPNIQVFILTYNRPDLVVKSISSVLQQSYKDMEVIVSDNSTNDATEAIIQNSFSSKVKYIKRTPSVGDLIAHLNIILKEVAADFFMIFHDDDIMYPNMVETLYNKICSDSSIAAVAANARIVKGSKYTAKASFSSKTPSICINTPDELVRPYLCGSGNKIAPFPSYMYRKEVAEKIVIDPKQGGKYSDTSFLIKVAQSGKIIWVNPPLMDYYFHTTQLSYTNDFLARLRLIYFISSNTNFKLRSKELRNYRLMNVYGSWVYSLRNGQPFSLKKKVMLLFFKYSPFSCFPKIIFRLLTIKPKVL
ncbi:MAG: glycosyltransferase [Prevotellaceae bacterium]|jgi:GT2 family glycosyltransferase|nr:glycosyltransferase [Prevotellaceae bacterium]